MLPSQGRFHPDRRAKLFLLLWAALSTALARPVAAFAFVGAETGLATPPTASRAAQLAAGPYVKASNTDAGDLFGYALAVSGDTLVVGAPGESSNATTINGDQADDSATGAGAAYVFVRSGGVWVQQAYLKAANAQAGDFFGTSVAIWGDTIVVGANGEDGSSVGVNGNGADNGASSAGATYVFTRTGAMWSQQAYLKASNPDANDQFGRSVAIAGDTVIVGATGEDSNASGVNGSQADNTLTGSGAAYVFGRSGTTWTQSAYLKAHNPGASDVFGYSVAAHGDTVVVGAYQEDSAATSVNGNGADNTATEAGAAYVFVNTSGVWSQQAYLKAANAQAGDLFGWSVALSNDTVVVGAPNEDSAASSINGNAADNTAPSAGAAYVFARSGVIWTQQAYLKAANAEAVDLFGQSVALDGASVLVGAMYEDSAATGINGNSADNGVADSGAAYVFSRLGTAWSQSDYLKARNPGAGDNFGTAVAVSGQTIAAGAPYEDSTAVGVNGNGSDNSAVDSGAAYVFESPSGVFVWLPALAK